LIGAGLDRDVSWTKARDQEEKENNKSLQGSTFFRQQAKRSQLDVCALAQKLAQKL